MIEYIRLFKTFRQVNHSDNMTAQRVNNKSSNDVNPSSTIRIRYEVATQSGGQRLADEKFKIETAGKTRTYTRVKKGHRLSN